MKLAYADIFEIGTRAFTNVGASKDTAQLVMQALLKAELDGMPSHGLSRIPFYVAQAKTGKVQAAAEPKVENPKPAVTLVDANFGFAYPAIQAGLTRSMPLAKQYGLAFCGIKHSHHCGMLGHVVEQIAQNNLIGLAFSNSPKAMAPWGGQKASFGTNPIAFGCPRNGADPIIVDMSLSKVARGKVMLAKQQGAKSIPEGWALDNLGKPTTDPDKAMAGTMVPMGDAKGAALALMVEILSATLTGSNHAFEASSLFEAEGPAPAIGQSFILIDPTAINPAFQDYLARLLTHIKDQAGTRLPGERRFALRASRLDQPIEVPDPLYAKICALAEQS